MHPACNTWHRLFDALVQPLDGFVTVQALNSPLTAVGPEYAFERSRLCCALKLIVLGGGGSRSDEGVGCADDE